MSRGAAEHRFCNVQVRTWEDSAFRGLSKPVANAQTLWLYLLCGTYTTRIPGVVYGGRAAMAEALCWPQEDFDRCFAEIESAGMALADWQSRLVYLPNAFSQQPNQPHSPSVCATWRKVMNDLPDCELLYRVDNDLRECLRNLGEPYLENYLNGNKRYSKTLPTPPTSTPSLDPSSTPNSYPNSTPSARAHARGGTGMGKGSDRSETDRVEEQAPDRVRGAKLMREWSAAGLPPNGNATEMAVLAAAIDSARAVAAETGQSFPADMDICRALKAITAKWAASGKASKMQPSRLADSLGLAIQVARGEVDLEAKPAQERARDPPRQRYRDISKVGFVDED